MPDEDDVRVVPEPAEFMPYQVVIPWPGLHDQFVEWVASKGWELSPRLLFGTEENEIPTRFVQPTQETIIALNRKERSEQAR
jgi:hypothetical protein